VHSVAALVAINAFIDRVTVKIGMANFGLTCQFFLQSFVIGFLTYLLIPRL